MRYAFHNSLERIVPPPRCEIRYFKRVAKLTFLKTLNANTNRSRAVGSRDTPSVGVRTFRQHYPVCVIVMDPFTYGGTRYAKYLSYLSLRMSCFVPPDSSNYSCFRVTSRSYTHAIRVLILLVLHPPLKGGA